MNTTRTEACALMYLLMRRNFEFAHHKSFTRVHLQVRLITVVKLTCASHIYQTISPSLFVPLPILDALYFNVPVVCLFMCLSVHLSVIFFA